MDAFWQVDFGVTTRFTLATIVSDQSTWIDEFSDVYLTVGDDPNFKNNPKCAGSPFYPTLPTTGVGIEASCNMDGRYMTVYQSRDFWLAISMVAVFIECVCTSMTFTATLPVYADVSVNYDGPSVTLTLTEASTTNPSASAPFCSVNYKDDCPTPFEVTLDNLDPLPSFMTLSQYKVDMWKLVIAPTLLSQVGIYNLRVRNYIA